MKTVKKKEMRKEYRREDLGVGVRGKYHNEYKKGTNLVLLSMEVAAAFPDDNAVNSAFAKPDESGETDPWHDEALNTAHQKAGRRLAPGLAGRFAERGVL
jgi:hypothetical protein